MKTYEELTRPRPPRSASDRFRWADTRLGIALILAAVFLSPASSFSLETPFNPKSFRDEDAKTVEDIAAYRSSARHAALVVAGYPEELMEIQKIQQKSADDFAALLDSYPRETQKEIWKLVRYPGLAKELGRGGRKSKAELARIAENYPSEDRGAIAEQGRQHYAVWVQIYALDLEVEQTFFALLSPLPEDVRDAFDELTDHPGLTSLLIDNMHMTTLLGAAYREDPAGVETHFNALHDEVVARRADEERAWAEEVANPEAAEELEYAAREFADEYGYDLPEEVEATPTTTIHVTHYVDAYPYPYWFGYPYWYDVAYWYPRPVWGHVGFHFGFGHGYVSVGLPSLLFLDWYHYSYAPRHRVGYYSGHHHTSYHQVTYYEQHRPHYTAGHRRHHDSHARRAQRDPRRHHDIGTRRASYRTEGDRLSARRDRTGDGPEFRRTRRDTTDDRRDSTSIRRDADETQRLRDEPRRGSGSRDRQASTDRRGRRDSAAAQTRDARPRRRREASPGSSPKVTTRETRWADATTTSTRERKPERKTERTRSQSAERRDGRRADQKVREKTPRHGVTVEHGTSRSAISSRRVERARIERNPQSATKKGAPGRDQPRVANVKVERGSSKSVAKKAAPRREQPRVSKAKVDRGSSKSAAKRSDNRGSSGRSEARAARRAPQQRQMRAPSGGGGGGAKHRGGGGGHGGDKNRGGGGKGNRRH